jgi:FtsH-binding integral membrane protein
LSEFCQRHKITRQRKEAGGRDEGLDLKAAIRDTPWMLQNLYPHLLSFHGLFRWVVLAAALAAIFVASSGWSGTKPASTNLLRFSIIFVVAMDIEFITGLLLYFGTTPGARAAVASHAVLMFLAVICAHAGAALSRKGSTDLMKYRGVVIACTISLLLMLSNIPWRSLFNLGS